MPRSSIARPLSAAVNGLYFPANEFTRYSGVWTCGDLGADIGWVQDSQFDFAFAEANVALLLREDDYVASLYATIDGQPANAPPQDASGSTMVNLTSDTRMPQWSLIRYTRSRRHRAYTPRRSGSGLGSLGAGRIRRQFRRLIRSL